MAKGKEITVAMLNLFAKRAGLITELQKRHKELREEIYEALQAGSEPPVVGPYILQISPQGGKDFSWEQEYFKLRVEYERLSDPDLKEVQAQAIASHEMEQLKEKAPDKEVETILDKDYVGGIRLEAKPNPNYKTRRVV